MAPPAARLDSSLINDTSNGDIPKSGAKNSKNKPKSVVTKVEEEAMAGGKQKKRSSSQGSEEPTGSRKMPKRAAASKNLKEKSFSLPEKSCLIEVKRDEVVEQEFLAVHVTAGQEDADGRPNRRLTDFILHDETGKEQPLEMMEVKDLFISGLILPNEEILDKKKEKGVRCEGFGRIETWDISGYEEGSPVIWLSTDIANYDCMKPATSYRKYYDHFYEKARACIEVYQKLSISAGGNPDISLDELLAGMARSMSGSKRFSGAASVKKFVVSQGDFIYKQLIGLDTTSKKNDRMFLDIPVLAALRDESKVHENLVHAQAFPSSGSLKIGNAEQKNQLSSSTNVAEEDEDMKLARLLQEEEYWGSMKQKKGHRSSSAPSTFYIKINEDEIANDYPLPAYYKTSLEETDEYIVFDNGFGMYDIEDLPKSMLHNWSLYNSDARLISLELLPMRPCSEIDVTIFGSGIMTADDGSGFNLDTEAGQSSSGSGSQFTDGIPIYLSAIKEWMIEFGSSMIFISIRTDMAWYRLGKPSKQYAPWYETILKTARLAINVITLLKEQSRVSRLSFAYVIKMVSEFGQNHQSYISSDPAIVERYIVVHGQIILQLFAEFPDAKIKKCAFITGLMSKMEERRHTKWLVKKHKVVPRSEPNLNPRAAVAPVVSKRKAMQATTTKLINRIWGEYYSNYSPEDLKEGASSALKEADEADEQEEEQEENEDDDAEGDTSLPLEETSKSHSVSKQIKYLSGDGEVKWDGDAEGKTNTGCVLYKRAIVHGEVISVGQFVSVEVEKLNGLPDIFLVEYLFESPRGRKKFHGRKMEYGCQTVLGNASSERELFLTNECNDLELQDIKLISSVDIRKIQWGCQHRKDNISADKSDIARAEERKKKGQPVEYYCKSLYWPERGAFFRLPYETLGLGTGICHSCKLKEAQRNKDKFIVHSSKTGFQFCGTEYALHDYIYASPYDFHDRIERGTHKSGRNVGSKAYVVCQLLEIIVKKEKGESDPKLTEVKVRRFFRPEDISNEKAYCSDIREVYYSEETHSISVESIEGKCQVRRKHDIESCRVPGVFQHIFFCENMYDPATGSLKKLPAHIKVQYSGGDAGEAAAKRKKGKCKEGEDFCEMDDEKKTLNENRLATLDIFAGCGGLSEGLELSGVSSTKWAIEYEEPAGDAFKLNHPQSLVFVNNCNVILRAVMEKGGDLDDCISTTEAAELAAKLDQKEINSLPIPGQVDFINGGPPCQGFSGMNRFNQSTWSKVQCEMILAFLSFADYFRPRYFLLENVRNFVSFNKGQTFRLTLASLLEIGYQVRFGILEAGAFGVSQSRKRVFIWAASPDDVLPEWPEPMHVFSAPELKISKSIQYAAVRSTASGAPFRSITVRDTIGDLPPVGNGASKANMEYQNDPVSWFQKTIRGDMAVLNDHISKEMNELNLIRCQKIPKRPGADWRDLPDEKVKLSSGQLADLIPWCLPNTAERHNQWKGLFGRLDWEGNFPTSITDPQPMGKVGMCFHPDQDRILTVRECARSQGFPDSYKFSGNIQHKHRQIGNAVPPPIAFALGRKLKEAVDSKSTN